MTSDEYYNRPKGCERTFFAIVLIVLLFSSCARNHYKHYFMYDKPKVEMKRINNQMF